MIKNYTSTSKNTFDVIQKCLASHGAQKLMFDYGKQGEISALSFVLLIDGNSVAFKLPARIDHVEEVLKKARNYPTKDALHEQAYRTGWANIRDWVTAQMALVDTEMAKVQEVFLPYVVAPGGKTLFESMQENKFLLPGESK